MSLPHRYRVLARARQITGWPDLEILEVRKYLGTPLAQEIRAWLLEQPQSTPLALDFSGVRAVTLSVAEELGPLLMQSALASPGMERRYPVYVVRDPEPAYTFSRAFAAVDWAALALVQAGDERTGAANPARDGRLVRKVLGQLSPQMEKILILADELAERGEYLTSEILTQLDFMAAVTPAARSKRLTELYARRLLAFTENPRNPKERLFTPVWRLDDDERRRAAG